MAYDVEEIAGNLRALRAKRGLTQAEVAKEIGVDENSISGWEQGRIGMTYANAWKLAEFYGVSLDALGSRESAPAIR